MRPIIFRGKLKDKEQADFFNNWVYGDLIHYGDGSVWIRQQETGQELEIIPETVGQYTGQDDINKTKIFDGDITKSTHVKVINDEASRSNSDKIEPPKIIETVYFNQIDWFDGVRISGWRIIGGRFQAQLKGSTVHNMKLEVVGNIYDNKNLING